MGQETIVLRVPPVVMHAVFHYQTFCVSKWGKTLVWFLYVFLMLFYFYDIAKTLSYSSSSYFQKNSLVGKWSDQSSKSYPAE